MFIFFESSTVVHFLLYQFFGAGGGGEAGTGSRPRPGGASDVIILYTEELVLVYSSYTLTSHSRAVVPSSVFAGLPYTTERVLSETRLLWSAHILPGNSHADVALALAATGRLVDWSLRKPSVAN